mgnify:CR=1 FL=1
MYLDENNFAFESDFMMQSKPLLKVDKTCRIIREEQPSRYRRSLIVYFVLAFIFLVISVWLSMFQPHVLHG